jgi:hypothetical protein
LGLTATISLVVFVSIRLAFSSYALLIENHRGLSALQRSSRLVRGRFWAVLVRFLLPKMLFFFVLFALQGLLLFVLQFAAREIGGLDFLLVGQIFSLGRTIVFLALSALIQPLVLTADYLIFRSITENEAG